MKKIYINRRQLHQAWGGGMHFINAMARLMPEHHDHKIMGRNSLDFIGDNRPNVLFCVGLDRDMEHLDAEGLVFNKMLHPETKMVLRVNECDARKSTKEIDRLLIGLSKQVDATIFVSDWMKNYFKEWHCENSVVIRNGIDRELFKPEISRPESSKIRIMAHHWSDNRMKGADYYEKIDEFVGKNSDRYSFTYIGRHSCNFKHTEHVQPLYGKDLADRLAQADVYVTASRFDPGPNSVLEALSCEIPTYSYKDGGGCVEFAGKDHVYSSWSELENILLSGQFVKNDLSILNTWQECAKKCSDFIEAL
jgi:glycosyltransferase involved in cell wall biosynthesis